MTGTSTRKIGNQPRDWSRALPAAAIIGLLILGGMPTAEAAPIGTVTVNVPETARHDQPFETSGRYRLDLPGPALPGIPLAEIHILVNGELYTSARTDAGGNYATMLELDEGLHGIEAVAEPGTDRAVTSAPRYVYVLGAATPPSALSTARATDSLDITLTWTGPALEAYEQIEGYDLLRQQDGDPVELVASLGPDETTHTHRGAWVHDYVYHLAARTNAGTSTTIQTSISIPTMPTRPAPDAIALQPTAEHDEFVLSWAAVSPSGDVTVTGYHIERSTNGGPWSDDRTTSSTVRAITVTVPWGNESAFRVRTLNDGGAGEPSATVAATAPEAIPPTDVTNLTLTLEGRKVHVTWAEPTDWGTTPFTGYTVERRPVDDPVWEHLTTTTATTHTDAPDWNAHSHWEYRVGASNQAASSDGVITGFNAATIERPGVPTNATIHADSTGAFLPNYATAILNWDPPANHATAPVWEYQIHQNLFIYGWTLVKTVPANASMTIIPIQFDRNVEFRIDAVNLRSSIATSSLTTPKVEPDYFHAWVTKLEMCQDGWNDCGDMHTQSNASYVTTQYRANPWLDLVGHARVNGVSPKSGEFQVTVTFDPPNRYAGFENEWIVNEPWDGRKQIPLTFNEMIYSGLDYGECFDVSVYVRMSSTTHPGIVYEETLPYELCRQDLDPSAYSSGPYCVTWYGNSGGYGSWGGYGGGYTGGYWSGYDSGGGYGSYGGGYGSYGGWWDQNGHQPYMPATCYGDFPPGYDSGGYGY